jgi:hypothetical protein
MAQVEGKEILTIEYPLMMSDGQSILVLEGQMEGSTSMGLRYKLTEHYDMAAGYPKSENSELSGDRGLQILRTII